MSRVVFWMLVTGVSAACVLSLSLFLAGREEPRLREAEALVMSSDAVVGRVGEIQEIWRERSVLGQASDSGPGFVEYTFIARGKVNEVTVVVRIDDPQETHGPARYTAQVLNTRAR